jgi:hypothetical protein
MKISSIGYVNKIQKTFGIKEELARYEDLKLLTALYAEVRTLTLFTQRCHEPNCA